MTDARRCRCRPGILLAVVAVVCLGPNSPAIAQVSDDAQLWLTATTSGHVAGPWRASAEVHARWVDDVQHYQRTVLRLQGGRALSPQGTAWFGVEQTWAYAGRTPQETRIWQQVFYAQPAGAWTLTHRVRLEERFIEGADGMVPRLRYNLRGTRPLRGGPWGAIAGAEIYLQLRDASRDGQSYPAGLDRTRFQAGVSRRLSPNVSLEPTYLLQFINAPATESNRREHLIHIQLVHRF